MIGRRPWNDGEEVVGERQLTVLVELIEAVVVAVSTVQLGDEVEPQRHPTCFVVMSIRYRFTCVVVQLLISTLTYMQELCQYSVYLLRYTF